MLLHWGMEGYERERVGVHALRIMVNITRASRLSVLWYGYGTAFGLPSSSFSLYYYAAAARSLKNSTCLANSVLVIRLREVK